MAQYYLVEADTDFESLFATELERVYEDGRFVFRKRDGGIRFNHVNRPRFFGNLSSLLRTATKPDAPPMELVTPDAPLGNNRVDAAIVDAERAVVAAEEVSRG
jgi:hypothetical protein